MLNGLIVSTRASLTSIPFRSVVTMLRPIVCVFAVFCLLAFARPAAAHVHAFDFGKTEDGQEVRVYHVKSNAGLQVRLITRGASTGTGTMKRRSPRMLA